MMNQAADNPADSPHRALSLFDTTSIIVGIIIGAGLYRTSGTVASFMPGPWSLLGIWALGGGFAFLGSLCYAELATMYPAEGGDYVFLSRAFGRRMGFVFAWSQLWIVRPGSIGGMAYVFGDYASRLYSLGDRSSLVYAALAVLLLTLVNMHGVQEGKWTQNILTTAKVLGLLGVVAVGLWHSAPQPIAPAAKTSATYNVALAMVFVLYAYGGWNDISYVGAEVRDPKRNILRALLLGTGTVTVIYLLANLAFWHALGFTGVRNATAVAAEVASLGLGKWGEKAISILICISALGAINGMVFTGARIYYALGKEHRLFAPLGVWSVRWGTPLRSLALQGVITLTLMLGLQAVDSLVAKSRHASPADGFEQMARFMFPFFWLFMVLVSLSLFWLRRKEPHVERPFRVSLFPLVPILFCAGTLFMLYSSVTFAWSQQAPEAWWSIGMFFIGVVLCLGNK